MKVDEEIKEIRVGPTGNVYVMTYEKITALTWQSTKLWEYEHDNSMSDMQLGTTSLFVSTASYEQMLALNLNSGELQWSVSNLKISQPHGLSVIKAD